MLVDMGIPEKEIAIKTSKVDDLGNTDLLKHDCEIRYIITVNALKEGGIAHLLIYWLHWLIKRLP